MQSDKSPEVTGRIKQSKKKICQQKVQDKERTTIDPALEQEHTYNLTEYHEEEGTAYNQTPKLQAKIVHFVNSRWG